MRIVIDLQSNQSPSRVRGIGQYAMSLTKAIVPLAKKHSIFFILNGLLDEAILPLRAILNTLVPPENIRLWYALPSVNYGNSQNEWRRKTAEITREALLAHLDPDMVLVMSLFEGAETDAITSIGQFNANIPTAVILYDLIPLLYPKQYLQDANLKKWYMDKLAHLKNANLLLAISEASRKEALEHLALADSQVITISSAVDTTLFHPFRMDESMQQILEQEYGISQPFVLYVTAGDARKNTAQLIKAYAKLSLDVRSRHQLVIVSSSLSQSHCNALEGLARTQGMHPNEYRICLQLTGKMLSIFYNACKLFIFPSYHEGFGLPLLEAMTCGKPVLGSNTSSIPEVIQCEDALFNPFNTEQITTSLARALTDDAFLKRLTLHSLERASAFSWEKTAQRALTAMEEWHAHHQANHAIAPTVENQHTLLSSRPKLAYVYCFKDVTPSSRRSQYSTTLLKGLVQFYDVDFISSVNVSWLPAQCQHRDFAGFKSQGKQVYDRILYLVSDAPLTVSLFDLTTEIPGILLLQDFFLPHLFDGLSKKNRMHKRYESHGYPALIDHPDHTPSILFKKYPSHIQLFQHAINAFIPNIAFREAAHHFYGTNGTNDANEWCIYTETSSPEWYFEAIESSYQRGRVYQKLIPNVVDAIHQLPHLSVKPRALKKQLPGLAHSLAQTFAAPFKSSQLLLDVSILVRHDSKTGIQRVVRAILWELLHNPPEGFRVEPVYSIGGVGDYRYARRFTGNFLNLANLGLEDDPIDCQMGDHFLSIDLAQQITISNRDYYQLLRQRGICVRFIVYDLLPIELPHVFQPGIENLHREWLKVVSENDGAICISKVVADSLKTWMHANTTFDANLFKISWFHLGADFKNTQPSRGIPPDAAQKLLRLKQGPAFLMVGTIEPRKGYEQALAAFEKLWESDECVALVIIGKQGWLMEAFTKYLRHHPEKGRRLFWFEGISDEYMEKLYSVCSCLLVASLGEGFGLPLIEAAQHHLPIVARDLPIFREVAQASAYYFQGDSANDLALALKQWLALHQHHLTPCSTKLRWLTWHESVKMLLQNLSLIPNKHAIEKTVSYARSS